MPGSGAFIRSDQVFSIVEYVLVLVSLVRNSSGIVRPIVVLHSSAHLYAWLKGTCSCAMYAASTHDYVLECRSQYAA